MDSFTRHTDSSNRILLVDDDDAFRPALKKRLESWGYLVTDCQNGKEAQQLMAQVEVDVVISDIRMPEMDGIELTKYIKENYSTPVILITGFAEILETQEAHLLGSDEFVAKPFEKDDIINAIERCLCHREEVPTLSKEYCKLGVEDFTSGRQIQFNIFVRLTETKFVKIAHRGEDLSLDRIRYYKSKGLKYLYLKRDDFKIYVGFNLTLTKAIRGKNSISDAKKINLLRHTGEILLEQIAHDGVDADMYDGSIAFVETALELLCEEPRALDLLESLNQHTDYLYAHSVGTSLYSVMLANEVGWTLPTNKFKVAIGGLLHDIGHRQLGIELLMKSRNQWTLDEVKIYESHPMRSLDLLREIESIPQDVLMIAKEHHEDALSQGFPSRLKRSQLHPMAKLVAVANEFCNRVVKNPHYPLMTPSQAITDLLTFKADRLDADFMKALIKLFNFEIPASLERKKA